MTRTQLQEMTDRELVELAARPVPALKQIAGVLIQELAARLEARVDDDYPFPTHEENVRD